MNAKNGCKFLMLCALGASLSASKPSFAKSAMMKSASKMHATMTQKAAHPTQMTGVITSMTRTSLTVKPAMKANGSSKTVTIPASAKVMLGAAPSSLSKLKAGEKVVISMNAKGAVTRVQAAAAKPKMMKVSAKKM